MTVCLDKSLGGTQLAEVEFNMADFFYGDYKEQRLILKQHKDNDKIDIDEPDTYIEIGLKGTKADGLVQKRMSAIKSQVNNEIKNLMTQNGLSALQKTKSGVDSKLVKNLIDDEMEQYKKEAKERKKEYERKIAEKNTRINELLNDLDNKSKDIDYAETKYKKLSQEREQLQSEVKELKANLSEVNKKLESTEKQLKVFMAGAKDDSQAQLVELEKQITNVTNEKDAEIKQL